ncbi:MAG TPA: hypothetical protein VK196_07330 [Magnetospirillum sp.]|nr:hypothetical protein [Magnetospirillum sp.]
MSENKDQPQASKTEMALRLLVLGAMYALAIVFLVAFSPMAGFVSPHPLGEVGRIAATPASPDR